MPQQVVARHEVTKSQSGPVICKMRTVILHTGTVICIPVIRTVHFIIRSLIIFLGGTKETCREDQQYSREREARVCVCEGERRDVVNLLQPQRLRIGKRIFSDNSAFFRSATFSDYDDGSCLNPCLNFTRVTCTKKFRHMPTTTVS